MRLKELVTLSKPFIIEFSGTPRTGKTSTINNLYDFFKKGGFNIQVIQEFTTSNYYKDKLKKIYKNYSIEKRNIAIIDEVFSQLIEYLDKNLDIIVIDRSINDRQIWNYRCFNAGNMSGDNYQFLKDKYIKLSKQYIDFLVITYADSLISLKRDYNCSLSLDKRSFLNIENINSFNDSLDNLKDLFSLSVDNYLLLDTSDINLSDVSVEIADNIMPAMRKSYIKEFKKKYKL